jgi:hypothetical protein
MAALIATVNGFAAQLWNAVAVIIVGPDVTNGPGQRLPATLGTSIDFNAEPDRVVYTGRHAATLICTVCCKVAGQVGRGWPQFNIQVLGGGHAAGLPAVQEQYTAMDAGAAMAHAQAPGRAGDRHRRRLRLAVAAGIIRPGQVANVVRENPVRVGPMVRCNACALTPEGNTRGYATRLTAAEDVLHFAGVKHHERVAENRLAEYNVVHDHAHRSPHVRVGGDEW